MRSLFYFILAPFTNRLNQGEGGLLLFVLTYLIARSLNWDEIVYTVLLALITLCALYGFNDFVDRYMDLANPKKDRAFTNLIIHNHVVFMWVNATLTIGTIVLAFACYGIDNGLILAGLYLLNIMYSLKVKAIPFLDILVVMLWGAGYIMVFTKADAYLILMVGVMTGISHFFQMMVDKTTDEVNKVTTAVVLFPQQKLLIVGALSVLLCGLVFFSELGWWSLILLSPILFFIFIEPVIIAWHLTRLLYFSFWLYLINFPYVTL